jgi:valyl-tRNA synthetase
MSAGIPRAEARLRPRLPDNKGEKMSKSVGNVVDPFAW